MSIEALQLVPNHIWKARPGNLILCVDRGAVRFEYPKDWILYSGSECVCLLDGMFEKFTCVLAVAARRTSIGSSVIPLTLYMNEICRPDRPEVMSCGDVVWIFRPPLEAAWFETSFLDPIERREARRRVCIARAGCTRTIITFDFRPDDELRHYSAWSTVMETLVVGEYIEDPETGRRREKRG
jgi:hypothetical protein